MEKGGPGSADGTAFYSDDRYFLPEEVWGVWRENGLEVGLDSG